MSSKAYFRKQINENDHPCMKLHFMIGDNIYRFTYNSWENNEMLWLGFSKYLTFSYFIEGGCFDGLPVFTARYPQMVDILSTPWVKLNDSKVLS